MRPAIELAPTRRVFTLDLCDTLRDDRPFSAKLGYLRIAESAPAIGYGSLSENNGENTSKTGATRCKILRLKCTKFDFRTPLAELTALPRPLAVFKVPTSTKGGGEKRREGER